MANINIGGYSSYITNYHVLTEDIPWMANVIIGDYSSYITNYHACSRIIPY